MAFPPQFLDEIRTRLSVSTVAGRKVKLIRRGREFVGLSPFTNEKSPSFTINDDKGFYHCFSSGEHGDIFTFIMKTMNLSFPEAVERLADEAGLEMPRQSAEDVQAADHAARIRLALEAAGTPIGLADLLIAATARRHGCTLVTHNTREFSRVPGLLIEDWY